MRDLTGQHDIHLVPWADVSNGPNSGPWTTSRPDSPGWEQTA